MVLGIEGERRRVGGWFIEDIGELAWGCVEV